MSYNPSPNPHPNPHPNTLMEVHEPAVWKPCHLHRTLVRLLSDRGVRFGAFEALQARMTNEMDTALGGGQASAAEASAAAVRLLRGEGARLARETTTSSCRNRSPALEVALQMAVDGWPVSEPFLSAVLHAVRHKLVQTLLTKCRIHEPQGAHSSYDGYTYHAYPYYDPRRAPRRAAEGRD